MDSGVGFEPTNHGFADRTLRPLGHPEMAEGGVIETRTFYNPPGVRNQFDASSAPSMLEEGTRIELVRS